MAKGGSAGMGNRIAPPRFILFVVLLLAGSVAGGLAINWLHGFMLGFDVAAFVFLAASINLLADTKAADMRKHAAENDANRIVLLVVTGAVTAVVLVTVGAELVQGGGRSGPVISLVVATLVLCWLFTNLVFAFHYAHMFYRQDEKGADCGGIGMPGTEQPDYSDFVYFAFTLGMTFQTSDTAITSTRYRRVVIFHCFAAFVFNIGVLAFTINVLGGGG
jgi:uncharacterized membrane protein